MILHIGDRVYTLNKNFELQPHTVMSIRTICTETQDGQRTETEYVLHDETKDDVRTITDGVMERTFFSDAWDIYLRVNKMIDEYVNSTETEQ